ncbi:Rhs family protein, partial [Lachnospiraceae bacterium OttesenSCG-928-J05]|nr:Rhs family protein [Lachnospiraceae bacterium OttesenSCG-928-J05]
DLNQNLIKVMDRTGAVTEFKYDTLNRLVETIRPNEMKTVVTYDALNHVTNLKNICSGCQETISTYAYTYNEQGYIIKEKATESLAGYVYDDKHDGKHEDGKHDSEYPHGNKHDGKHDKDGEDAVRVVTSERSYEYDENWQLTKCTEEEEYKGTTVYTYKYDKAGNRTAYEKVSGGETKEKYSYKYNDSNQLISKTEKSDWRAWKHVKTTYEYDRDGNLISENGKDEVLTYEYTAENRLRVVTGKKEVLMAATYDGDGNRIFQLDFVEDGNKTNKDNVLIPESAKTKDGDSALEELVDILPKNSKDSDYTITQYVNDINQEHAQAVLELKTDGRIQTAYTYGVNRLGRDTEEGSSYYLYDGRGSVAGITATDGTLTDSYRYDPYGNLDFGTPVSNNYYGYNAESTNTNTGLQYLRARYYNPQNGNFTTEDTETGTKTNPLTRNRYTYVTNNPLNYQDPSGHFLKSLWNGVKKVASKVVSTVKKVVKTVVNTVKSAVSWVANAIRNPKQVINDVKQAAYNGYQKAASATSTFISSAGNALQNTQRAFTSFTSYVAHRTAEIKDTVVRELCTTANRISDALGKVDWKSVGKVAVGGLIIAGLGVATVLTGGAAAAIAGAALTGALVGGGTGAVIGGISSAANGDGFLKGAADGFMWGTIGGAISGGAGAA